VEDVLRPGSEMVAAGYTMYGSSCNLVLSTGQGVDGFTLDEALGEFILTHPDIKVPSRGKIYSFNEGNSMHFYPPVVSYLESVKYPSNGKPYSARYIGSMVADVHRTLLYGGIFGYPDDKKSKDGKLRMLYEAFPMAFLTEQVSAEQDTNPLARQAAGQVQEAELTNRPAVLLRLERSESSMSSPPPSTVDVPSSWDPRRTSRTFSASTPSTRARRGGRRWLCIRRLRRRVVTSGCHMSFRCLACIERCL